MIIKSLLDTDLYKFTMGQIAFLNYQKAEAHYRFQLRDEGVDLTPIADDIRKAVARFKKLTLTGSEVTHLAGLGLFADSYLAFLRRLNFRGVKITVSTDRKARGGLKIDVSGPWKVAILVEVPLLALINEIYFASLIIKEGSTRAELLTEARERLAAKIEFIKEQAPAAKTGKLSFFAEDGSSEAPTPIFRIAEFGTRRRFSADWQREVVETLKSELGPSGNFAGTSNVLLAKELGIPAIGTMAHEYLQAMQALETDYRTDASMLQFQRRALEIWQETYGDGDPATDQLMIALSDVVTSDAFFRDFSLPMAKAYRGVRHDSGDPREFAEKLISHYQKLGIDPSGKLLLFSDGLNVELAYDLFQEFSGRIKTAFAIGTNLSNDVGLFRAMSIVIKLVACSGRAVAKLSDNPAKAIGGTPEIIAWLKRLFLTVAPSELAANIPGLKKAGKRRKEQKEKKAVEVKGHTYVPVLPKLVIAKLIEKITSEIRAFTDVAVIGMSGGADSTLVAALATLALGKENVYSLHMPYSVTDSATFNNRSFKTATHLGIGKAVIPVAAAVDTVNAAILAAVGGRPEDNVLTKENTGNTRSRMRMMMLYGFCHHLGTTTGGKPRRCRVLGTGNLSEDFIGYDTKGGDAIADLFPVGELYKSEVYRLLDYLVAAGVLLDSHIDRVPSAGLWDGQTDEGELGYSYNEMRPAIDRLRAGQEAVSTVEEFVRDRYLANKHKHEAPPVVSLRPLIDDEKHES